MALLPLLALAACAPKPATAPAARTLALDCARPFEDQAREIAALPGMKTAEAAGEPYDYFNAEGGQTSYVVTRPEAPAHPAIVVQQVEPGGMRTGGCAWGDKAAYEALQAYVKGLERGR